MRILYLSDAQCPDYMSDMLFHGLRRLLGPEVVDVNRLWYMYAHEFGEGRHDKSKIYGHGFTMHGLLDDDSAVDRTDLRHKVRTRYFDLIIYGNILRCQTLLDEALGLYPQNRLLFIDGEDHPRIAPRLTRHGVYFKRELAELKPGVWPIQFAIPEERIGTVARPKTKTQAFIDPRNRATYIYRDEASYYGDYAESLFGVTIRKAGWDCLRHYEIMANQCIPNFLGLEQCPMSTMVFLPRTELYLARCLLESRGLEYFETNRGRAEWQALWERINVIFRRHCTTLALARYVLDVAAGASSRPGLDSLAAQAISSPTLPAWTQLRFGKGVNACF